MSPGPSSGNPFEGMPFFGDLAKLLSGQGPVSWEAARQFALWQATEGQTEPNVDPLERMRLSELVRVADLQVSQHTGLSTAVTGAVLTVLPVTRAEWAQRTLQAYRPFLERLATTLAVPGDTEEGTVPDPGTELLGGLAQFLGPVLLGLQSGLMVGQLARRSLGQYDLPLPRPPADELLIVPANLDELAEEWSLERDDLRLWLCLSEVTHHAVLGRPHVRARLERLLLTYAGGFTVDPSALEDQLGDLDPMNPESLKEALGNPEAVLGAIQSDAQRQLLPQLEALTAVVEGFVDYVMDAVGRPLISSYGQLAEALRRRRAEASSGDRYVGRLFGLELTQANYERGAGFVKGVVERAGSDALARLWADERELPTPAEVDAPGLWLARIDL